MIAARGRGIARIPRGHQAARRGGSRTIDFGLFAAPLRSRFASSAGTNRDREGAGGLLHRVVEYVGALNRDALLERHAKHDLKVPRQLPAGAMESRRHPTTTERSRTILCRSNCSRKKPEVMPAGIHIDVREKEKNGCHRRELH